MRSSVGDLGFDLVDAAGAGVAEIRDDGTIARASDGFARLAGAPDPAALIGAPVATLLPMLPELTRLGDRVEPSAPVFVAAAPDARAGRRRGLSAALVAREGQRYLILRDRDRSAATSGPSGPRRTHALQPRRAGVRTPEELSARIERAISQARAQAESVSVVAVHIAEVPDSIDLDGVLLGCIRGVDDVARAARDRYLILMPDTDAAGSEALARRVRSRIQGHGALGIGIAASATESDPAVLVARADEAARRARARGGGVLVAENEVQ